MPTPVHRWCHPLHRLCFNYFVILIQPFNVCPFSLQCWMSSQFHLTLPSAQLTESNYYQWGWVLLQSGNVKVLQTLSKRDPSCLCKIVLWAIWWYGGTGGSCHMILVGPYSGQAKLLSSGEKIKEKEKGADIKGTQLKYARLNSNEEQSSYKGERSSPSLGWEDRIDVQEHTINPPIQVKLIHSCLWCSLSQNRNDCLVTDFQISCNSWIMATTRHVVTRAGWFRNGP